MVAEELEVTAPLEPVFLNIRAEDIHNVAATGTVTATDVAGAQTTIAVTSSSSMQFSDVAGAIVNNNFTPVVAITPADASIQPMDSNHTILVPGTAFGTSPMVSHYFSDRLRVPADHGDSIAVQVQDGETSLAAVEAVWDAAPSENAPLFLPSTTEYDPTRYSETFTVINSLPTSLTLVASIGDVIVVGTEAGVSSVTIPAPPLGDMQTMQLRVDIQNRRFINA